MKTSLLAPWLALVLASGLLQAQESRPHDRILKRDRTRIEGKVIRVTEDNIEIDPVGSVPFLLVKRSEVFSIIYRDGTVVDFGGSMDGPVTMPEVPVPRVIGILEVTSTPSGATIFVDGLRTDSQTPAVFDSITIGMHRILVAARIRPYHTQDVEWTEAVEVRPKKKSLVHLDLLRAANLCDLYLTSNKPSPQALLRERGGTRTYTLQDTGAYQIPHGEFELTWTDDSLRTMSLSLSPQMRTNLFVPCRTRSLPLKEISDHPQYVAFDTYYRQHYNVMPESEMYTKSRILEGIGWFLLGGGCMYGSIVLEPAEDTEKITFNLGRVVVFSGGLLFATWGIQDIFDIGEGRPSETGVRPIPKNIQRNNEAKGRLALEYDRLRVQWLKEIEKENANVKEANLHILEENTRLAAPRTWVE